jgi:subfamily B ATP-binding cassette protein MsbA
MEPYETRRAKEAINEVFTLNIKAARTRAILRPVMEILSGLAIVAVLLYGGNQVIDGARDPGSFFAFIFALLLAYEPVKKLARLHVNLQEGLSAAQRLFVLLDEEAIITEKPDAKKLSLSGGEILFEDVNFSYGPEAPALHDLTLKVPAGKTVALVGPSGAGKSTLLNLIPRFYDVNSGRVIIDGQNVRDITLNSLRSSIALVSQEVLLFDDTIRANIAYGRPGVSDAEIIEAAKNAGAHDFITGFSEGYDTEVGPRGSKLSGGQRQRVAIARAMVRDAAILLLDEATSALDSESERKVQSALKTLMAGKTTVVIAHRLSTVVEADIIYVMNAGRVVESGGHAELLAKGGAYAKLYALQFAQQDQNADQSGEQRIQA